ncbi:MAG: WD40 repeat domain-containing protein [Planctomycetota bacterium]|jgi:hypothetical protein
MNWKALIAAGAITLLTGTLYAQVQVGADIDGEAAGDQFGYSVSLSADGSRVAISGPHNDDNGNASGHVRVLQWSGAEWDQLGTDIDGEAAGDFSGESISLSADGNRLAIGATMNDGGAQDAGHVRVYQWSGSSWTRLGDDIDGDKATYWSGYVSLSDDGSRLAVGAPDYSGMSLNPGEVRIYQWSGSEWSQMGSTISGEWPEDQFGFAVSLSADGSRLAVGAYMNNGNGIDAGHVRAFEWSDSNWTQLGADIDGEAAGDFFGGTVSLSDDGNRLAVGATRNDGNGVDSGHVRVFQWSGSDWVQLGADIDGVATNDQSGLVSLSADGDRLAIGAFMNDGNGTNSGQARVFQWLDNDWTQIGLDINGEANGDLSGSVSLSADGSVLAVGANRNDGNGDSAGHARVYAFSALQNQLGFNGLFSDPYNSGHGLDVNNHEQALIIYYYGHSETGQRLWLISENYYEDIVFNQALTLRMLEIVNGTFGNPIFDPTVWGELTIEFADCDTGHAILDGLDGYISFDFVRLTGLQDVDCN